MSRLAVQHVLKQQRSITWLSTLMDPDNFFFFFFNQGNDSHENVRLFQPSFSDYPDIRWPLVVWWLWVFFNDCDAVHFPKDAFGQRRGILHNWWCPHGSVCRFRNPNAVEKSLPSCVKPTRTWGKQECPSLLGCSVSSAGTPFNI